MRLWISYIMYIEWLIIYILYIQGGPKWYCNRVIFKYLTVVFFIGKEGMPSGPSRFRLVEGPPLPSPTPFWIGVMLCTGFGQTSRSSWTRCLSRSSLNSPYPMHSITLNQNWKFVRVTLDPHSKKDTREFQLYE